MLCGGGAGFGTYRLFADDSGENAGNAPSIIEMYQNQCLRAATESAMLLEEYSSCIILGSFAFPCSLDNFLNFKIAQKKAMAQCAKEKALEEKRLRLEEEKKQKLAEKARKAEVCFYSVYCFFFRFSKAFSFAIVFPFSGGTGEAAARTG